jgi:hypothetical protein
VSALARLLEQATPGPWRHVGGTVAGYEVDVVYGDEDGSTNITRYPRPDDARLIALAPDMARLLIDMTDSLTGIMHDLRNGDDPGKGQLRNADALLARFAELEQRAAP